jgi:PadR family transcriptional regulator, regulatory protein AphA
MSSPQERELTTTSYAILGLLAVQPWSSYALTKQLRRSLRHFWPRAESNVYAEPKRLVAAGLARAEIEASGKRHRTVYSITDAGQQALANWLAIPSAPTRVESEALVKVLFANYGSRAELLGHLRGVAVEAEETKAFYRAVAAEYLRDEEPFPGRAHINALIFRWIWEQAGANARWAAWAIAQVERWPNTQRPHDGDATLAAFGAALETDTREIEAADAPIGDS